MRRTDQRNPPPAAKEHARLYWRSVLGSVDAATSLPLITKRSRVRSRPAVEKLDLSRADTLALLRVAEKHDLPPELMIEAAWACLLSRYTGERELLFGVVLPLRSARSASKRRGPLPIRVTLPDGTNTLSLVQQL